jgi:hypothetical protein
MSDYATLKNRVLTELNRLELTGQASASVQTAIKFYETTRFWFNEQRATQGTQQNKEFYALPGDYISYDSLILRQGSTQYPMTQISYETIENFVGSNPPSTGRPTHFALYANQIRVYPTPDATSSTLVLSYIRSLPALSNDTDNNEWTRLAEGLIRSRAQKDIAATILHDPDLASVYAEFEAMELSRLTRQTHSRIFSGKPKRNDYPVWRVY